MAEIKWSTVVPQSDVSFNVDRLDKVPSVSADSVMLDHKLDVYGLSYATGAASWDVTVMMYKFDIRIPLGFYLGLLEDESKQSKSHWGCGLRHWDRCSVCRSSRQRCTLC